VVPLSEVEALRQLQPVVSHAGVAVYPHLSQVFPSVVVAYLHLAAVLQAGVAAYRR